MATRALEADRDREREGKEGRETEIVSELDGCRDKE